MRGKNALTFAVFILLFAFLFLNNIVFAHTGTTGTVGTNSTDVNDLKEKKERIKEEIERLKEVSENEKVKQKENILKNAKKAAEKAVNSAIKKLNSIKNRIDKMKAISDAEKKIIIDKIDIRISVLNAKLADIDTATTRDEIHAILGASRKELKDTRDIVHSIVQAIHKTHLLSMIKKIEDLVAKIEEKSQKLSAERKEKIDAAIAVSKEALTKAKAETEAGDFKNAKLEIKAAHKALSGIMEALHNKKHEDSAEMEVEK